MNKFIVFEGLDGSGKTTQLKLLGNSLKKIKKDFFLTREPGGTHFSEMIRNILVQKNINEISPNTELLLIYAARYEHIKNKILPNLKKRIVICDRFYYSTFCSIYSNYCSGCLTFFFFFGIWGSTFSIWIWLNILLEARESLTKLNSQILTIPIVCISALSFLFRESILTIVACS